MQWICFVPSKVASAIQFNLNKLESYYESANTTRYSYSSPLPDTRGLVSFLFPKESLKTALTFCPFPFDIAMKLELE